MNQIEFDKGMYIMGASGILQDWEKEKSIVWFQLLEDVESVYFEKAVIEICKTTVNIYPGTVIPALIRETADKIKKDEQLKRNRENHPTIFTADGFKEKFKRIQEEAIPYDEFLKQVGLEMKGIPDEKA